MSPSGRSTTDQSTTPFSPRAPPITSASYNGISVGNPAGSPGSTWTLPGSSDTVTVGVGNALGRVFDSSSPHPDGNNRAAASTGLSNVILMPGLNQPRLGSATCLSRPPPT